MDDLNNVPEFSKYFREISPSEINIDKEEIFYRDKYNDIINYIKVIISNHEDLILKNYVEPKGAILINVNPGTDIIDYIKVISKNYYLNLIELNDQEIVKSPDGFIKSFLSILEGFKKKKKGENKTESDQRLDDKKNEKKILLINQQPVLKKKFKEINLLESFINIQQSSINKLNLIDLNLIVIWINYAIKDITVRSTKLYNAFDLFFKIPLLDKIERETVLRDFLEKNPKIVFDINAIINYTDQWEVKDIKQLLKVGIFKHFLNSELNETSNEITDILIDLIVSGEYLPSITAKTSESLSNLELKEAIPQEKKRESIHAPDRFEKIKDIGQFVENIRESRISDFMLNQLYENAASINYNELLLIIDKLNKKEPLEDNDRKLLATFPFILNDAPTMAQINLEKAKRRVDLIKQAFGK